jgi:YHS domain-containing protein
MKNLNSVLIFIFSFTIVNVYAQVAPVDDNGIAIGGYDVVAYFSNKALKGSASLKATHEKVTYLFSSQANKEAFVKNPAKYLPEYDGYCAWGVGAKATKFPINPETFKIVNGKLYLFFNGPFNGSNFNTLDAWNTDEPNLLKAAEKNWPQVKK